MATSAMATLEADDERVHPARVKWVLSPVDVHDVTKEINDQAPAVLLRTPHLHGHKCGIHAALAAIAREAPQPVTVLTPTPRT